MSCSINCKMGTLYRICQTDSVYNLSVYYRLNLRVVRVDYSNVNYALQNHLYPTASVWLTAFLSLMIVLFSNTK